MTFETEVIQLLAIGACGALVKDLINDGCIELPKKIDSKFSLGFISSMIIGAFAGYFVDGSLVTSFLAGMSGSLAISKLVPGGATQNTPTIPAGNTQTTPTIPPVNLSKEEVEKLIRAIAKSEGIDEELAVKVAKCESGLNCNAVNINTTGSKDRGLYQWNDYWHKEITDEMAFNPTTATKLFCKAVREGHIDWWNASKKCWG